MSGCNGPVLSDRKTEAIVSYPHTNKALIPCLARDRGLFVSFVILALTRVSPACTAMRPSGNCLPKSACRRPFEPHKGPRFRASA